MERHRLSSRLLLEMKLGCTTLILKPRGWLVWFGMVWSEKGEPAPQKVRRVRSAKRTMIAIFFSWSGIVASVPLEEGKTVTSSWYTEECLPVVFEEILKGRPTKELRRFFLHHDNAPAHTARKQLNSLLIRALIFSFLLPIPQTWPPVISGYSQS